MKRAEDWVCCQLGAREHYAVPRALAGRGRLEALVTDAWAPPCSTPARLGRRLAARYHPELAGAPVQAATLAAVLEPPLARLRRHTGWRRIMARNASFQRHALERIARLPAPRGERTLFAYSYAADRLFGVARAAGWRTILGQIDPGPVEATLVDRLYAEAGAPYEPIPPDYWLSWRREVALADLVLANSDWSRQCLVEGGVPAEKIVVVPLAYEGTAAPAGPEPAGPVLECPAITDAFPRPDHPAQGGRPAFHRP